MKRLNLFLVCVTVGVMLPTAAYAQTAAPMPTLSMPLAVTTILSLLLGVLTQIVQTGKLFGQWVAPTTWLPELTMAATFLGGMVGYFSGLSPIVLDGTTIFYAIAAGIMSLLAGAAPGLAVHAHVVVPQMAAQARARLRPIQLNSEDKTQ